MKNLRIMSVLLISLVLLTSCGLFGGNSLDKAINLLDADDLFKIALIYRYNRFHTICKRNHSQYANLRGWINRLNDFAKKHNEKGNFVAVMK
jgi:hypothetical protein